MYLIFEWHLIISKSFHSYIEFSTKLCVTSSFYYLLSKKKCCNLQITNVAVVAVQFELICSDSKTMFFPKFLFPPHKNSSLYLPTSSFSESLTSRFPIQRLSVWRLISSSYFLHDETRTFKINFGNMNGK